MQDDRVIAGRYRLRRRLGQGAMGIVWEAYDEFLRRRVAVKEVLLPPGVPPEEAAELRERTLREARAIAALSHPNVITLHDVARDNDEPFVVTEYMAAHSLAGLVRVLGPLPTASAAAIADAVAAALASAHQAGITHRDVKPGNVLVATDGGQVKLTDFGIARNVSEHTITQTGIMLGSPAYMAPEVGAGHDVTPAADLWGLGATLFAVVEGQPPYDTGRTALEVVNQVVHGEIPRPASTGPLSELVTALMVKDPEARLPLAEVRARLHPLLPAPGTPLLTDEQREQLAEAPDAGEEPDLVPLATEDPAPAPPAVAPAAPALAPAPGPLPFDVTARAPGPRRRGQVATTVLVVVALLLFAAGTGGGFALARVVGGEPIEPPEQTTSTTEPPVTTPAEPELEPRPGDAATRSGTQGGGYTVLVPPDWTAFVEERTTDGLDSTRVYYVSPDGTRMLTVDRFPSFYPDHRLDEFVEELNTHRPAETYEVVSDVPLSGQGDSEPARQLTYRSTASAAALAPDNPAASNLNRTTFANLLPMGPDLWVVAVTVPVDQEDTGRRELFDRIAPEFTTT